ncbi:40S ribosomal protein S6 (nucleomorph) [Chroomonas mesostigmatica CCMP1168]|uniref:40S ribosomal protein S6 n=1 Tax=Chroomonas mesostigmatica CCMP1168 TaxID=1195612 RepID=J7G2I9_9CRYP|nr:40S ribosomal protein S6 [Chroomonas mesostigmatica CCMP1168]|mmetsp:Transcript_65897/g.162216  ORF Transcript_65897/g.162216 Transcript_65897/m.162216 type:complete len:216 (-) Transcript_65897:1426-2073(-)
MKINISNPKNGCQKVIDIENENDLRIFYEKKISNIINISSLGQEWSGYIVKITGGQDKQGFPMVQGVVVNKRVKLLLSKGMTGCRGFGMKDGERSKKSVRGCYVSPEIAVLNLKIVKEGNEILGLTDLEKIRRFGPKRSSKIRKLFRLSKKEDLRKYVIEKNKIGNSGQKKQPKIQRLITPISLQRKRNRLLTKKKQMEKAKKELRDYTKILLKN